MAKIEKSIEIEASPKKVFSVTKELERMPEWMASMKSCKITSKKRYGKGVTAHCVMQQMDRTVEYDIEMTEYDENKKAFWHCEEPMRIDGSMTLIPTNSKTKVTMTMDYDLPYSILGQVLDKLKMSGEMEKSMEESLKNLKKMLEE